MKSYREEWKYVAPRVLLAAFVVVAATFVVFAVIAIVAAWVFVL